MSTQLTPSTTRFDREGLIAKVSDSKLKPHERVNSVKSLLEYYRPAITAALPKHITPDRIIGVALNCLRKNHALLDCSFESLFSAIREAAIYGWELGGVLGQAYLVPFKNDAVLIPGYKGLIDLARRSGQVSTISLEVVHDCDQFSFQLGDSPSIKHVPNDKETKRDSRPITHVYAVVVLRDGGVQRNVWSKEKIDAHKERYSKNWKKPDSAWQTAWPAMAKKTVIRDMINRGLVPLAAEYRDVIEREDTVDSQFVDIIPQAATAIEHNPTADMPAFDKFEIQLGEALTLAEAEYAFEEHSKDMTDDERAQAAPMLESRKAVIRQMKSANANA